MKSLTLSRKVHAPIASRVQSWAYQLGVVSGGWYSQSGKGVYSQGVYLDFNARPYVMGRLRHLWFHLPRYGHKFYAVFGDWCGRCSPWPCCGAVDEAHAIGCDEA